MFLGRREEGILTASRWLTSVHGQRRPEQTGPNERDWRHEVDSAVGQQLGGNNVVSITWPSATGNEPCSSPRARPVNIQLAVCESYWQNHERFRRAQAACRALSGALE